jgi:hypothetical protein
MAPAVPNGRATDDRATDQRGTANRGVPDANTGGAAGAGAAAAGAAAAGAAAAGASAAGAAGAAAARAEAPPLNGISSSPREGQFVFPSAVDDEGHNKGADRAAIEILQLINPTSKAEDVEYAGVVQEFKGKVAYSHPHPMGERGGAPATPPVGPLTVGDYHTHGAYDIELGHANEIFSEQDKKDAREHQWPSYLITPFWQTPEI